MLGKLHIFGNLLMVLGVNYFGVYAGVDELDAVVVIFRHGDRTPIRPYPTDPYKNASFWPVDFGQLTNSGKLQQLQLGQWLRDRYQNFLPSTYSEKDIYVHSTDVDRTLMSAEANLAGLYPPNSNQVFDHDIKWQPIPVHTKPEIEDALLAAKKPCPKYNKLLKQLSKSDYFRNISHQNHDLYAYLTRYTGETISSLEALEYLYSTFFIEVLNNYTLPDWALKVYPDKLRPWAFLSFAVQAYTPELARLKVGPLFNHIISFFSNHTAKASNTPKFLVFSAHDATIANVLNTMGAFEYHAPPYASTILFELRRRSNGRNYVNLFYKNTSEARQIVLRNCEVDCDLADFVTVLKQVTITLEEWEKECKLECPIKWSPSMMPYFFVGSISMGMMVVMCVFAFYVKRPRKREEGNYMQLPNEEYA